MSNNDGLKAWYEHLGLSPDRVIASPLCPPETMYLFANPEVFPEVQPRLFETLEPRWEAVDIVQEGLAEIVAWLRAAGHHLPDAWEQQERARWERRANWRLDETVSMSVHNPRALKITGIA